MNKDTDTSNTEATDTFKLIREGSAPKLIDKKKKIGYVIGKNDDIDVIKIISNSSSGLFSTEPVSITSIQDCLSTQTSDSIFSSRIFRPLYNQKSNNNTGFIAAILRHEGVLKSANDKRFKHQLAIKSDKILDHLTNHTEKESNPKEKAQKNIKE